VEAAPTNVKIRMAKMILSVEGVPEMVKK